MIPDETPCPGFTAITAPGRTEGRNDDAFQLVLAKIADWKRRYKPARYEDHVSELIRAGKAQVGTEGDFWCAFEDEHCPPTGWREDWEAGELFRPADLVRWLRNRSASIKALAERFPPRCLVRGLIALRCPGKGQVAIVVNYADPNVAYPFGSLSVMAHPQSRGSYLCAPGELEVVGYHKGLTRELFSHLLARQTQ